MVDDELPPDERAEPVTPPGPRRSTYTPPPSPSGYDPLATDDDALAGALTQEFQRWVPPTASVARPTPVAEAAPASPTPPPPAPPPTDAPRVLPPPPQRISLTDEQLLEVADLDAPDHDTAALLDLVERELALRQTEARRVAEWEDEVRATESPETEEIVSRVRFQFTGVIPIVGAAPVAPAPFIETPIEPAMAAQLAAAPPPAPPSAPAIDIALADAPPPYGLVPSAVAPPPSVPVGSLDDDVDDVVVDEPPVSAFSAQPTPIPEPPIASVFGDEATVPPLVEPSIPPPASSGPVTGPTTLEELFGVQVDTDAPTTEDADAVAPPTTDAPPATDAPPPEPAAGAAEPLAEVPVAAPVVVGWTAAQQSTVAAPPAGRVEHSALEPTPAEHRAGRSVRLFWLWFAVNASVVSIALGAVILGQGVSLRQAVLATFLGVALSFLPLGLGTLASKWSGQPTMVVSRATFGTGANTVPALLALVTRLVWAAALLWMLGVGTAEVLLFSGLVDGIGSTELALTIAAAGLVVGAVVSGLGFGMIALVSAIVSVLSGVLVVGLIALTADRVDIDVALSLPDGDWMLLVSGVVLVFSVVGLAWANSSGDLARYQARGTTGASAVLCAAFGATIPAFLLICWGAVLAASDAALAQGLQVNPIEAIARLLPSWYPVPLLAAVALSLVSAVALALYSSGFALLASGLRAPRWAGVLVSVVLTGGIVALLIAAVPDAAALFRDVVTTLAVPVAAWAGIFGAETMIRTRRVHSPSLLRSGGVYPAVRWVNLLMLLVITAVGWGFSTAQVAGLQWQGFLFTLTGVDTASSWAQSDPGVLVALLLGLLTPIVAGVPALRRLQAAERTATESQPA